MNMITNVDMMLEKDPEAQKLLEQCLVRMPNQNVSQEIQMRQSIRQSTAGLPVDQIHKINLRNKTC